MVRSGTIRLASAVIWCITGNILVVCLQILVYSNPALQLLQLGTWMSFGDKLFLKLLVTSKTCKSPASAYYFRFLRSAWKQCWKKKYNNICRHSFLSKDKIFCFFLVLFTCLKKIKKFKINFLKFKFSALFCQIFGDFWRFLSPGSGSVSLSSVRLVPVFLP